MSARRRPRTRTDGGWKLPRAIDDIFHASYGDGSRLRQFDLDHVAEADLARPRAWAGAAPDDD